MLFPACLFFMVSVVAEPREAELPSLAHLSLSPEEREEYLGYIRANKFVAVLRREAKKFKSGSAA